MSNETKKFAGLESLQAFLNGCKTLFASITHKHKLSDITDYKVDTELSSASNNPIANSAVDAEFDAIADAMGALETAIDSKADASHTHSNYATTSYVDTTFAKKSDVKDVDLSNYETKTDASAKLEEAKEYTDTVASGKANTSHSHDDRYYTESEIDSKLSGKANSTHNHDSAYDAKGSASDALAESKEYTDTVASGKANTSHSHSISDVSNLQTTLDGKVSTSRTVNGKALSSNITLSASDVGAATSTHTHDGYVNQNAFSNVKVGSTTVAADTTTDTLEIAAGTGISVSGDATNDKVTITNSGVRSIGTGSSNGTISVNTNGTAADVAVKGLGSAAYTASTAYDAAGTAQTKADAALASAKSYTDTAISNLINSAPETLDTLGEIATAMADNADVVEALNDAIGTKVDKVSGKGLSTNDYTTTEKNKLSGIASGAQVNQNAFSNVKIGDTTIAADTTTDTLTLVAGSNITLTPDATGDSVTIAAKDTTYTLGSFGVTATAAELNKLDGVTATTAELNYVDGVTSNIQTQLDGKAASGHTHNYAGSSSAGGAATSANKVNNSLTVKLNGGTTEGTNMFTFDGSGAKSVNVTPSAIGAAASSHNHDDRYYTETEVDTKLSGKANTSHGNHVPTTQTASNKVFLRNDNTWATVTPANIGAAASSHTHTVANITDLTATAAELNYMDGVTSNVQTQLDGKAASSHNHAASNITSGTLSSDRLPTVPIAKGGTGATTAAGALTNLGLTATATELNYVDGVTSSIQTQLNGKASTATATQSANGLMSAEDKSQLDYGGIPIVTTSGSGTAYTATVDGMTELKVGAKITIIPHVVSAAYAPTLNVNSLGAKAIRMPVSYSSATTANGSTTTWLAKDRPVTLEYNGTYWLTIGLTRPSANYLSGTVPVANGGTGATDAAGALTNLGLTATATELNYMDGVTSNVQTQLDTINNSLNKTNQNLYQVDLNVITYKTSGYCNECTNTPSGAGNGFLEVIPINHRNSDMLVQRYTPYWANEFYIRQLLSNGTWTDWVNPFSNYLPLWGGQVSGTLHVGHFSDAEIGVSVWGNSRNVKMITLGENFGFWDSTHARWLMNSVGGDNGSSTFYQNLYVNDSKVMTAANFSLSGTTLTITT